jgi:putative endonuclease
MVVPQYGSREAGPQFGQRVSGLTTWSTIWFTTRNMHKKELGSKGEKMASDYLEGIGYRVLDKNFRKREGEIDLIAEKDGEIAFIEVKTRGGGGFGYPEEAVDDEKIEKMTDVANLWLEEKEKLDNSWRIDIIAIELDSGTPKITHIKNI